MPNQDEYDIRRIFSVISRRLWIILGCVVLLEIGALLISYQMTPIFSASALVRVQSSLTGHDDYSTILASELLAQTYSKMLDGQPVLEETIAQLGIDDTAEELAERVKVESIYDTQLIRVIVNDTDPAQAALIANTIAKSFTEQIQGLQSERYASSLLNIQEKMDSLLVEMEDYQREVDSQREIKLEEEANLTRLERLLIEYQSELQAREQEYQNLKLTVNQLQDSINIVEEAKFPSDSNLSPYTATVILLLENSQRISTYGHMLTGRPVLEAAIEKLGLDETPDAIRNKVTVEPVFNTQLISLNVQDNDATQATLLANAIADAFIKQIQIVEAEPYTDAMDSLRAEITKLSNTITDTESEIDTRTEGKVQAETELARLESLLTESRNTYLAHMQSYDQMQLSSIQSRDTVILVESAEPPIKPSRPRTLMNTTLATGVGVLLGISLAFLVDYLESTIRTAEDIEIVLGTDTLGTIHKLSVGEEELVTAAQPLSPSAEAYRTLSTNIRFYNTDKPLHTILVTSPGGGEGKSITVANLAVSMAQAGLNVFLVDADLRQPRLHAFFDLDPKHDGLTEALLKGNIEGKIRTTQVEDLSVLTSGNLNSNPAQLITNSRAEDLLKKLTSKADVVLIDSPPILPVADAKVLAPLVDGILLVVEYERTRKEAAVQAAQSIHQVGGNLIGAILNSVPTTGLKYYNNYNQMHKLEANKGRNRLLRLFRKPLSTLQRLYSKVRKVS